MPRLSVLPGVLNHLLPQPESTQVVPQLLHRVQSLGTSEVGFRTQASLYHTIHNDTTDLQSVLLRGLRRGAIAQDTAHHLIVAEVIRQHGLSLTRSHSPTPMVASRNVTFEVPFKDNSTTNIPTTGLLTCSNGSHSCRYLDIFKGICNGDFNLGQSVIQLLIDDFRLLCKKIEISLHLVLLKWERTHADFAANLRSL
jgi:hypothetical protein